MRILLDDVVIEDSSVATVTDAIDAAATRAEVDGRLIVEVNVDGEPWGDREIDESRHSPASATEVKLVSADRRSLVRVVLGDAADALAEADRLQRDAADSLQADRTDEAMARLGEAMEIWNTAQQAVTLSVPQFSAITGQALPPELEADLEKAVEDLNRHLTALKEAIQLRDPSGLADTLLYDLPEVVGQWRELLVDLNTRLGIEEC